MSKQDLKFVIQKLTETQVHSIHAPQVRRACVAAIIRWRPYVCPDSIDVHDIKSPRDFLNQHWVNDCHGEAEMLFIERALRPGDIWSGHVAFPGGKNELCDKTDMDTVIRECKEEIGVDLSTRDFMLLGTLEHRNIKRLDSDTLMMILVPHVFLQLTPRTPELTIQASEVADLHWVPIRYLLKDPITAYQPVKGNANSHWPGSLHVPAIPLKTDTVYLWGMTLRMTEEILGMSLSPRTIMSTESKI